MKRRRGSTIQDAGVIGWISISEVFLLCGVTMLTVALAVQSNLQKTRDELASTKEAVSEVPELKRAIVDLERERIADRRTIAGLTKKLASADRDTLKLSEDVARLNRELQSAVAGRDALRETLATLTAQRDRLASSLEARLAELTKSRSEIDALRSERVALQNAVCKLEERLARIDESIVLPLKAAKLVVKVSCDSLPAGYDLDLYVQDPHDQVCSWVQPRTLWQTRETGLLILSEDLRNVRNTTEEIFYSLTIEPSDVDHPYLVFCMLRASSLAAAAGPLDVPVRWEVSMAWKHGLQPIGQGERRIGEPGRVVYANGSYGYPGLVPLTLFRRPTNPDEKPRTLDEKTLPKMFRGWSDSKIMPDASTVTKVRDN